MNGWNMLLDFTDLITGMDIFKCFEVKICF